MLSLLSSSCAPCRVPGAAYVLMTGQDMACLLVMMTCHDMTLRYYDLLLSTSIVQRAANFDKAS